jgi:uncharacterized membrane protein HdeD (DUF308 family)
MVAITSAGDFARDAESGRHAAAAWGIPVLIGIALISTGTLAILSSYVAGYATMVLLGIFLLVAGTAEIAASFAVVRQRGFWLTFLAGVLSVAVGVVLVAFPNRGLAATTLMIGAFFTGMGLFRVITAMVDRYPHWHWDVGYGVVASLLGITVLSTWPISALWVVGTLIGIELVLRGGAWLGAAMAIRRSLHGHEEEDHRPRRGGLQPA